MIPKEKIVSQPVDSYLRRYSYMAMLKQCSDSEGKDSKSACRFVFEAISNEISDLERSL